jgi:hypothetical protein
MADFCSSPQTLIQLRPILTVVLEHELEGQIPQVQVCAETLSLWFAATHHMNCLLVAYFRSKIMPPISIV